MKGLFAFFAQKIVLLGILGVVLGAGVVAFFAGGGSNGTEVLIVHPSKFVQEVSVSGKVIAAQDVDLGFAQSGRISRVYANVGQRVALGSLLAEVENGDLRATVLQKQAAFEAAEAELSRLQSGTREKGALEQANEVVINAIRDAYISADDAVHNSIDQFVSNPRTPNPQLNFTVLDSQIVTNFIVKRVTVEPMLQIWQATTVVLSPSSDLSSSAAAAQVNLVAVSAFLSDAAAALAQASISASLTQTKLDGYVSDVAAARTSIGSAITALTSAVTAERDARADLDATPETIAAQAARVKAAEAEVRNAQAQLEKSFIRAPFAGVIAKMDAKVGKIISPNTPEISLISTGAFQIESFVPEINVALLSIGNQAVVTLDAYGDTLFAAKVVSIDPAETVQDGVSTYRALLEFDAQDPRIKSGMTANIVITTKEKEGVIAVPQGIVVSRDGKKYVPILKSKATVEKEVTVGDVSSRGDIEILSGLTDGDTVILSENAK